MHYSWRLAFGFLFIIFVLLPCFFPFVINRFKLWRGTCLFKLIKSNPCNKSRTNVCGSLVLLLSVFMNIFPCLYLDNNRLILFCIAFLARNLLCFMIKPTSCFRLLWTFIDRLKWFWFSYYCKFIVVNGYFHCYSDLTKLM